MGRHVFIITLLIALAAFGPAQGAEHGVYVKAVERAEGSFDAVVAGTEKALAGAGWEVLASYAAGVQERCGMRAHVIVIHSEDYAKQLLTHGPWAAFALPVRVGVYENERGIHVAFANPASIVRTVLGDGVETALSEKTALALSGAISSGVKGTTSDAQLGQVRSKGRVGGMGGGDFEDKVEVIHTGADRTAVREKVLEGIRANDKDWKLVYAIDSGEVSVIGLAKAATEAKAFDIAGEKREEKDYRCPGLDHAAAFPIEVVVYAENEAAKVAILDEMYRMKVYFEDAGNWAFMKNMTMPGRIEDDVREVSTSGLK
jgi:uncharacterized protein (DUF302 family)